MALNLRKNQSTPLTFDQLDGNFEYFTGSHAVTGSLIVTEGVTGSLFGTASYALYAVSASYEINYETSSSYADTASVALLANTASYVDAVNVDGTVTSASYALTASYALSGGSGGNIDTSSLATTGSNTFTDNQTISGSLTITGIIQSTGSIYLKPDGSDVAERQFEIYNTAPSDIHFKGSATHSFFGDDTNYLKIDDSAATITIDSTNGLFINSNTSMSGDTGITGLLSVTGSTSLYNSGSTILSINGPQGEIFSISDDISEDLLTVQSGSNNLFIVKTSGSIILPTTQSAAPSWTGADGEIVPATVGGQYFLYMWMSGAWRSGSFV